MQAVKQKDPQKEDAFYESGFLKKIKRPKHNLKINERLRLAREKHDLKITDVIRSLKKRGIKMGHSTLAGYESDESNINHRYPSVISVIELADFYGCSTDYLFGLTDNFYIDDNKKTIDLRILIENHHSLTHNGVKLTSEQKDIIIRLLNTAVPKKA